MLKITACPLSFRYTPYLQHYCVHILQQVVHQRALRHLMMSQAAADAVLACLAYPPDTTTAGPPPMFYNTFVLI